MDNKRPAVMGVKPDDGLEMEITATVGQQVADPTSRPGGEWWQRVRVMVVPDIGAHVWPPDTTVRWLWSSGCAREGKVL